MFINVLIVVFFVPQVDLKLNGTRMYVRKLDKKKSC